MINYLTFRSRLISLCTILFVICGSVFAKTETDAGTEKKIERFALFIGANKTHAKDVRALKYAEQDAKAFANVLVELGNLDKNNTIILQNPYEYQLIKSISDINKKIIASAPNLRKEFVFYYSGHSNSEGLMLRDGTLKFNRLRQHLKSINVDLRLEVLDACDSGAFLRVKGGTRRPAVKILNANESIKGHVLLASSSSNEASQESDVINGSYFTYYLISALRGAGDVSGDQKVSLSEAYQYAYKKTYANTAASISGPQHPEYVIELSGQGDYILTDLSLTDRRLILGKNIKGNVYISSTTNIPVAELEKRPNEDAGIALPKGEYHLIVEDGGKYYRTYITINSPFDVILQQSSLQEFVPNLSNSKGKSHLYNVEQLIAESTNQTKQHLFSVGLHRENFRITSHSLISDESYNVEDNGLYLSYYWKTPLSILAGGEYHTSQGNAGISGFSLNMLTNLYSKHWTRNRYFNVLAGIGVYQDQISQFYKDQAIFIDGNRIESNTLQGMHIPFMLNMEANVYRLNFGVILRDAQFQGEKNGVEVLDPALQLSFGIKL